MSDTENIIFSNGMKLLSKIGEGSYAKVYLTEFMDENRSDKLACKVIDTAKAPRDFIEKFLPREIEILPLVNHPHIIRTHQIFQSHNKYFILMRYAENGDLLQFLINHGIMTEEQALIWTRQLVQALKYLHDLGIAHRDLKCENILITANYNIKLSDFGFSRFCVDSENVCIMSRTYCGSMSYAAPEIVKGIPYCPKISDIWSLGIVLFGMLNKALPFNESNTKKLYERQIQKRWKFRRQIISTISPLCVDMVKAMLEPQCSNRITIDEILSSTWLNNEPIVSNDDPNYETTELSLQDSASIQSQIRE